MICEGCEISSDDISIVRSKTQYYWDGTGENPNRDLNLCSDCATDYNAYWDERWAEYYRGLL